jgi:hypothetical protein
LQSTNYFASQNSGLHSIIALILSWPPVCRKVNLLLKAAPLEVSPNFTLQAMHGPWPLLMQTPVQVYQQQSEIGVALVLVLISNLVALLNPQIQSPVQYLHTCTFGFQIGALHTLL